MLSYHCLSLLTESHPCLPQIIQRHIKVTEQEISHIDSLIQSSETLALLPEDLTYYRKELENLRGSDIQLLQSLRSFAEAMSKILP